MSEVPEPDRLGFVGDWLVEFIGGCTCGTSSISYMHEPYCGVEPIENMASQLEQYYQDRLIREGYVKVPNQPPPNAQVP